jgi:diguanylate cyclase (GGDEF)-like protein
MAPSEDHRCCPLVDPVRDPEVQSSTVTEAAVDDVEVGRPLRGQAGPCRPSWRPHATWARGDRRLMAGPSVPGPPDARLSRMLGELAAAVDADRGVTLYVDDGEGTLQEVACSLRETTRPGRGLFRRERAEAPGATVLVSVPDARAAVLRLARSRAEPFSTDDRVVARLFARQLADQVAVEVLGSQANSRSRQFEAIATIAAQLTRMDSVEAVTSALCQDTRGVIPYDAIRVHLVTADGRTLEPVAFRAHHDAYAHETAERLRIAVGEGLAGLVAANGRPLLVPDVARDPRAATEPRGRLVADESMVLVPLRHDAAVLGVISLARIGGERFDEDDLRLLGVLADQVAGAIANARLLAGRDRLVEELRALLEIGQAGALAADEQTLAPTLAAKLRGAAHSDACVISRWDEAGTRLVAVGGDGTIDRRLAIEDVDILGSPATRRVLLDGARLLLRFGDLDLGPTEEALLRATDARSLLLLPLVTAGRIVGVVELYRRDEVAPPALDDLELYTTMANHAAAVLENARLLGQLRQAADVDQVTGVNNHRYLQERLRQEVARAARLRSPMAVLMIDLDGFKLINDKHGHADGDRVLRGVSAMLKQTVRTNDIVARYGGDEFVILMPDTDDGAARVVADRVVRGIRGQAHPLTDGSDGHVSCSVGLSVYPQDGRTAAQLLKVADAAMYGVKRAGGSRVGRIRQRDGGDAAVAVVA